MVRCLTPQRCGRFAVDGDYYTGLVGSEKFTRITPRELRQAIEKVDQGALDQLAETCAHKIVLIGGEYHTDSAGGSVDVDMHPTPLGDFRGLVLHANYVEAILSGRRCRWKITGIGRRALAEPGPGLDHHRQERCSPAGLDRVIVVLPFALSYLAFFNLGFLSDLTTVLVCLLADLWLHKKHVFQGANWPTINHRRN